MLKKKPPVPPLNSWHPAAKPTTPCHLVTMPVPLKL
ncbi:hypothetical protein Bhyg_10886 [Pseudolycoriella hygida]|uniref:Uncharacterized protein n=1 Tax=Pseudolycoriella hygida TaxID=35572 RepID=A0A9Q0MUF0_9DIPT|nr:hypothetical protein Bhyg_10886 [Pseudolycoriella hygida]